MSGRRPPLAGSFYGFDPAPPTAAEIETEERRARQLRERDEQERVNQYDITRGEFEALKCTLAIYIARLPITDYEARQNLIDILAV